MTIRGLRFAWDSEKAASNLRKHGVSFEEGRTIFADSDEVMLPDPDHSAEEERYISIGRAANGEVMLACYTEFDELIRLISVRRAAPAEIQIYWRQGDENA
jgi:uncharacterized DUF497 family protein